MCVSYLCKHMNLEFSDNGLITKEINGISIFIGKMQTIKINLSCSVDELLLQYFFSRNFINTIHRKESQPLAYTIRNMQILVFSRKRMEDKFHCAILS